MLEQMFGRGNVLTASAVGANKLDMLSARPEKSGFPSLLDALDGSASTVVLAGCVLNEKLARIADKIDQMQHRPRIVFLGAGARSYDTNTVEAVGKALRQLRPDYLVTRDSSSLDHFGKYFSEARQGIDCAYWVSDAVPALPMRGDYEVRTFNRMSDPGPPSARTVSFDHAPLRLSFEPNGRTLRRALYRALKPAVSFARPEAFMSDDIAEYLHLYSAAREVHTDMVHATVASAAYGTPVRMYHRSPRQEVITSVIGDSVFHGVVAADAAALRDKKREELRVLSEFLAE